MSIFTKRYILTYKDGKGGPVHEETFDYLGECIEEAGRRNRENYTDIHTYEQVTRTKEFTVVGKDIWFKDTAIGPVEFEEKINQYYTDLYKQRDSLTEYGW